jgi:Flp pilus assembly CpaE family ATPase
MDAPKPGSLTTVLSARADGATAISLGLAALASSKARTVLVDLNLANSEVATFLDLDESKTIYHLAYAAQLAPINNDDLRQQLQWRDGLAVLPGITHPTQREQITRHFLVELARALHDQFEVIVIDAGRVRSDLPTELASDAVLWVVSPQPRGLAALDRSWRMLEEPRVGWLDRVRVVVNRVSDAALVDVPAFLRAEYGLSTAGIVRESPDYWRGAELSHSLRSLTVPLRDERRFVRLYGDQAPHLRADLEALAHFVAMPVLASAAR